MDAIQVITPFGYPERFISDELIFV
jgi:hypothetical protein